MLIETTATDALGALGLYRILHEEIIVPGNTPMITNSPYREGYDWLFVYERKLFHVVEKWLKPYRYELIGKQGILTELLSNAYCHGHAREPSLPIRVVIWIGQRGLMILIEDSGEGFAVRKIKSNLMRGKRYYSLAGNGLRLAIESQNFDIFFNQKGNAVHLLFRFSSKPDASSGNSI